MPVMRALSYRAFSRLIFAFLQLVLYLNVSLSWADTLRINASQAPPYHTTQGDGFEDQIAKEIYRRLGYDIEIHDVPAARGLQLLDEGLDDGTLARNPNMSLLYPNLIQIDESVLQRTYVAFTRDPAFVAKTWEDLAPYRLGFVNGWKILERNIQKAASITKVTSGEQLFQLLNTGRIDVAVYNLWGGLMLIREMGLAGIRAAEPPLAQREVFFYLHRRHAAHAVTSAQALRKMKRDGTYDALVKQILEPLRN